MDCRFAQKPWHERVSLLAIYIESSALQKVKKNGSQLPENIEKSAIFHPAVTFSLVVAKRLKFSEKSFLRLQLVCDTFQKIYL